MEAGALKEACGRCGETSTVRFYPPMHVRERAVAHYCDACAVAAEREPWPTYAVSDADRVHVRTLVAREGHTTLGAVVYVASALRGMGLVGLALSVETGVYSPARALCSAAWLEISEEAIASSRYFKVMEMLPAAGRFTRAELVDAVAPRKTAADVARGACDRDEFAFWEAFINQGRHAA